MALLNIKVKEEMIKQIEEGTSINKISKSLNLGKSTIYYYYRQIKGKKYVEPTFDINFSEIEGEIVGIFAGDGSQYFEPKAGHYEVNVHFGGQNYWYALYVKDLFEKFFNKKFRLNKETLNRYRLRIHSKEIFKFFKNYLEYVPQIKHCTVRLKFVNFSNKFKIEFLRGLVDTDGCLYNVVRENRLRINYCTTSDQLSKQISEILNNFDIKNSITVNIREYRNEKPVYYVNVWKDSADKFINLVKPLKARIRWAGDSIRNYEK